MTWQDKEVSLKVEKKKERQDQETKSFQQSPDHKKSSIDFGTTYYQSLYLTLIEYIYKQNTAHSMCGLSFARSKYS